MIAISSFRPLGDCPADIALNQCRAYDSWRAMFDKIIWFGDWEPELAGRTTHFWPCAGKPKICELALMASTQPDWVCLLNADILVGPHWPAVEKRLRHTAAQAAVSRRWQFKGDRQFCQVTDWGLDFFCAHPAVWRAVAETIPEIYTLGRIQFDTWLLGFFLAHCGAGNVADLTLAKVVFHPFHGDRRDQNISPPDSPYLRPTGWPQIKVS